MSDKPINPLRRRMIEDMTVRNIVAKTRNDFTFLAQEPRSRWGRERAEFVAAHSAPSLGFP
jgi:hypothetical protein